MKIFSLLKKKLVRFGWSLILPINAPLILIVREVIFMRAKHINGGPTLS
jgi:hypothetical protein